MQPFFTTNESDIPLLEGLYIKERNPPAAIQGANLGLVCIVGQTIRGPVGRAVPVTSPARFKEIFGDRDHGTSNNLPISSNVWLSMLNKPFGKTLIVRVAAAAAVAATQQFPNAVPTNIAQVSASSPGTWGNDMTVEVVVPSTNGNSGQFDVVVQYNGDTRNYVGFDFTGSNDNSLQILGGDVDANWVTVTKLASGTPVASAAAALTTAGTDGTIADSDYTATGKGLEAGAAAKDENGVGAGVVFVAEYSSAAVKTKIQALAPTVSDRIFLCCPDSASVSASSAATEVAGFTRSDRIVYCFNHPYTLDPNTAVPVVTHPTAWMASVLSQIDVDIHPGEEDTKPFLAGITSLSFPSLVRQDYISLKAAGISALEKDDGYSFVSGVTTSLVSGKTEITRRRMTDYLQISAAKALKSQVKKKNTTARRKAILGLLDGFLGGLKTAQRIVEAYVLDDDSLNTDASRAAGQERILMRVKLISHILQLVLETEIGTSVVVKEAN